MPKPLRRLPPAAPFAPLLLLLGCGGDPQVGPSRPATTSTLIESRADYAVLSWDNRLLFNNGWGQPLLAPGSTHAGRIFRDTSSTLCGFEWDWPRETTHEVKAYAELVIGDKPHAPPGHEATTDPRFPLHWPTVTALWSEAELELVASGEYNLAYDLYLLRGATSSPDSLRCEVMVWLDTTRACPAARVGEVVVDGVPYALHANTDWHPPVNYVAFVREGSTRPRRVPLHAFVALAVERGYAEPDSYLAAVELGAEVWWGRGEVTIRDMDIVLTRR